MEDNWIHTFPRVLVLCEMQTDLSRILSLGSCVSRIYYVRLCQFEHSCLHWWSERWQYNSSTKIDVNIGLEKVWTAIDRLSIIWKSYYSDKIKRDFFQAVTISIQLYGYISWTLKKCIDKKLNTKYTIMVHSVLNTSWKQHATQQLLDRNSLPILQSIQDEQNIWDTAEEVRRNSWVVSYGFHYMDVQMLANKQGFIYMISVQNWM